MSRIDIGDFCYETTICMHEVKIDGVSMGDRDAWWICGWCNDNGVEIPKHFDYLPAKERVKCTLKTTE